MSPRSASPTAFRMDSATASADVTIPRRSPLDSASPNPTMFIRPSSDASPMTQRTLVEPISKPTAWTSLFMSPPARRSDPSLTIQCIELPDICQPHRPTSPLRPFRLRLLPPFSNSCQDCPLLMRLKSAGRNPQRKIRNLWRGTGEEQQAHGLHIRPAGFDHPTSYRVDRAWHRAGISAGRIHLRCGRLGYPKRHFMNL